MLTLTQLLTEPTAVVLIMCERRNTLVCFFDHASPRISAFEIHEWIHSQLQVSEQSVLMIQIYGPRRQVFIKFTDPTYVQDILHATNGITEYKHLTGEIFPVRLELAGMGTRCIRLGNLPPEISSSAIRTALTPYGEIQSIHEENWSTNYRYAVSNGISIVTMTLTNTSHHILP
jgi:hypothetical protein